MSLAKPAVPAETTANAAESATAQIGNAAKIFFFISSPVIIPRVFAEITF